MQNVVLNEWVTVDLIEYYTYNQVYTGINTLFFIKIRLICRMIFYNKYVL